MAYNRPDQVEGLLNSLRPFAPETIMVSVDGPKSSSLDKERVSGVIRALEAIDWTADIKFLIREKNVGIRRAVPDAVNWALREHNQIIVIEDDVRVGKDFFFFMEYALQAFENDPRIGHVSGYNAIPENVITEQEAICRGSIYPESYAWGTWKKKWQSYSDSIPELRLSRLKELTGSIWSALEWKINFSNARKDKVNTWAYRWVASLWFNNLLSVSPNANITEYRGRDSGTHTRTVPRWSELPLQSLRMKTKKFAVDRDWKADMWLSQTVFMGHPTGVFVRVIQSYLLSLIRLLGSKKFSGGSGS